MNVGFVGLGIMGTPMAGNLIKGGHRLFLYSIPSIPPPLVEAGGAACASAREVAQKSDIIITMVPDTPHVDAAIFGENGVAQGLSKGKLVIDMSSISPLATKEFAKKINALGCDYLDAPVSGGEVGAKNATLSIMVGGSDDDFATAKPILDTVGKTIVHVGANGAGQTVKAANQLIVAGNIELLAEAITFLKAYDVDIDAAVKVLGGGLAGSAVLDQKASKMLERNFDPGFRIALHHKDMGIVTAAAREAGVVTPLGSLVAQLMASALANGDGGLDHSALLLGVERLSGKEI
jgi:2-hydroxy-3-oxopropionate reductase